MKQYEDDKKAVPDLGEQDDISTIKQEAGAAPGATENDEEAILNQLRNRHNYALSYWKDAYSQSQEDAAFAHGDQWDDDVIRSRERDSRPLVTMNVLPHHIQRIVGLTRKSKFSINIKTKGGLDVQTLIADANANRISREDVMRGLIRGIEYDSGAKDEYIEAQRHAVESGFGWLMVHTERPVNDVFNVELKISAIKDRWSVLFDPAHVKSNMSDAKWCLIYKNLPKAEFEARYPDARIPAAASTGVMPAISSVNQFPGGKEGVSIYQYWRKVPVKRTYYDLRGERGRVVLCPDDFSDGEKKIEQIKKNYGLEEYSKDTVNSYKIMYVHCTNHEFLNEEVEWPGVHLPIVPVVGTTTVINNQKTFQGLISFAKEAQKMVNYWYSAATERLSKSNTDPWLVTPVMIANHLNMWNNPISNRNYLLFDPDESIAGSSLAPIKQGAAPTPTAELSLLGTSMELMRSITGLTEASFGQKSNETSGKAIQLRRDSSDLGSASHYMDHLVLAINQIGRILLDMIPRVYDSEQLHTLHLEDGTKTEFELNKDISGADGEENGEPVSLFDMKMYSFDMTVEAGADAGTMNEQFVQTLLEVSQHNPEVLSLCGDLLFAGIDTPYKAEVVKRLRSLIPPQFLTEAEREQAGEQEPTPEQKLQAQKLETSADNAKSTQASNEIRLEVEEIRADTAENTQETKIIVDELSVEKAKIELKESLVKLDQAKAQAQKAKQEPVDK